MLAGTIAPALRCRHRRQGPVAQWLEPAAHNRLVGGSSPSGPTTISRVFRRAARIAGFSWSTGRLRYNAACHCNHIENGMFFQSLSKPLIWSRRRSGEVQWSWSAEGPFVRRFELPRPAPAGRKFAGEAAAAWSTDWSTNQVFCPKSTNRGTEEERLATSLLALSAVENAGCGVRSEPLVPTHSIL